MEIFTVIVVQRNYPADFKEENLYPFMVSRGVGVRKSMPPSWFLDRHKITLHIIDNRGLGLGLKNFVIVMLFMAYFTTILSAGLKEENVNSFMVSRGCWGQG